MSPQWTDEFVTSPNPRLPIEFFHLNLQNLFRSITAAHLKVQTFLSQRDLPVQQRESEILVILWGQCFFLHTSLFGFEINGLIDIPPHLGMDVEGKISELLKLFTFSVCPQNPMDTNGSLFFPLAFIGKISFAWMTLIKKASPFRDTKAYFSFLDSICRSKLNEVTSIWPDTFGSGTRGTLTREYWLVSCRNSIRYVR